MSTSLAMQSTLVLNSMGLKLECYVYPKYISKNQHSCVQNVVLLLVTDPKHETLDHTTTPYHYLVVRNLSALLKDRNPTKMEKGFTV